MPYPIHYYLSSVMDNKSIVLVSFALFVIVFFALSIFYSRTPKRFRLGVHNSKINIASSKFCVHTYRAYRDWLWRPKPRHALRALALATLATIVLTVFLSVTAPRHENNKKGSEESNLFPLTNKTGVDPRKDYLFH